MEAGRQAERAELDAGLFQDAGEILVGDGEIAVHLRDQRRVELRVPAIDRDAEQQRQDDQHRQQRDREQPEADGAPAHELATAAGGIRHSTTRICGRWSCARCRAAEPPPRDCHWPPSAPQRMCRRSSSARLSAGRRLAVVAATGEIVGKGAEDQRALDQIAQLAHIARPVIARERRAAPRRRSAPAACRAATESLLMKMRGELLHVVAAVLQERQVDLHDVEAVEQVGPEAAPLDLLLKVGIGREDEAQVDRNFTLGADRTDAAVFQHAQQLALHRQRQLADLVEEQRAAMRIEEQALAPASPRR